MAASKSTSEQRSSRTPVKPVGAGAARSTRASQPGYTRSDALHDFVERIRLPLLFAALLALIGASRFDATRPLLAKFMLLALPAGVTLGAAAPLRDAATAVRAYGFAVAGVLCALAEFCVARALFGGNRPIEPVLSAVLVLLALLAAGVQAFATQNGFKTRFAACAGIATALAIYLPGHFDPREALGTGLAGVLVALFAGGVPGLLMGTFAASLARRS